MNRRIVFSLLGLLILIGSAEAQTVTWLTGTYVYDGAGNIKSIGTTEQYRYDGLSRLVSGTVAAGRAQSATYDAYGNIKTLTTDATTVTFGVNPSTNRVTHPTDPITGLPYNIFGTYDDAGRLLTSSGGVGNTFDYDAGDMVTKSTVEGTTKVHLYTANDERVASVTFLGSTETGSEWTLRAPSGKVLRRVEKTGSQWTWKEDYVYSGSQLLASEVNTSAQVLHYFSDHLGTPRLITANGGTKVAFHAYFPYGEEATLPSQDNEKLKFTGHERDAASLDYMHARYYGPKWGRFLSVDPILQFDRTLRTPKRWNRYSYALDNPLSRVDPDGRTDIGFAIAAARAVSFLMSYGAGYMDRVDPSPLRTRSSGSSLEDRLAYNAGGGTAEFVANNDFVFEASGTLKGTTLGVAVVNGEDWYVFGGKSHTIWGVAPGSMSFSFGVVENYDGVGSYGGLFTSVSGPHPLGVTVAGNPLAPEGAVSLTITVSSDVGLATQSQTFYVPLTSLSNDVQQRLGNGNGYVFIEGQLYRASLPPAK